MLARRGAQRHLCFFAAAMVAASAGGVALAQLSPSEAITQRQAAMKANDAAVRIVMLMTRGERPWNADVARQTAIRWQNTAKRIPELFPPGSGPESGETWALPAIWQSNAEFLLLAARLDEESTKLIARAEANDPTGYRAQFAVVGSVCSSCHEKFRKE